MLTREVWYDFWSRIRKSGAAYKWRDTDDNLIRRSHLADTIRRYQVDGQIAINYDQMDCDCAQWFSSVLVPAHAMIVENHVQQTHNDAEGPVRWWLSHPDTRVEYSSRDLALEAFEEGHPHVVHW